MANFPDRPQEPENLGQMPEIITTNGDLALLKPAKEIYPFLRVLLRIIHKLRNLAIKLKRVNVKPYMAEAKVIFTASPVGAKL